MSINHTLVVNNADKPLTIRMVGGSKTTLNSNTGVLLYGKINKQKNVTFLLEGSGQRLETAPPTLPMDAIEVVPLGHLSQQGQQLYELKPLPHHLAVRAWSRVISNSMTTLQHEEDGVSDAKHNIRDDGKFNVYEKFQLDFDETDAKSPTPHHTTPPYRNSQTNQELGAGTDDSNSIRSPICNIGCALVGTVREMGKTSKKNWDRIAIGAKLGAIAQASAQLSKHPTVRVFRKGKMLLRALGNFCALVKDSVLGDEQHSTFTIICNVLEFVGIIALVIIEFCDEVLGHTAQAIKTFIPVVLVLLDLKNIWSRIDHLRSYSKKITQAPYVLNILRTQLCLNIISLVSDVLLCCFPGNVIALGVSACTKLLSEFVLETMLEFNLWEYSHVFVHNTTSDHINITSYSLSHSMMFKVATVIPFDTYHLPPNESSFIYARGRPSNPSASEGSGSNVEIYVSVDNADENEKLMKTSLIAGACSYRFVKKPSKITPETEKFKVGGLITVDGSRLCKINTLLSFTTIAGVKHSTSSSDPIVHVPPGATNVEVKFTVVWGKDVWKVDRKHKNSWAKENGQVVQEVFKFADGDAMNVFFNICGPSCDAYVYEAWDFGTTDAAADWEHQPHPHFPIPSNNFAFQEIQSNEIIALHGDRL